MYVKTHVYYAYLLRVCLRDAVKLFAPVRTTKVRLCLETSDGITIVSLLQHNGKCLTVLPASSQVDGCVQEITANVRVHIIM